MAHHGVTPQYIMRHHGNFCDILKHHKVILRLNTALIKVLKLCKVAEQLKFISKQCNCHKIGSHNGRFWGRFGTIYNLSDIIVYRAITRVMSCVVYLQVSIDGSHVINSTRGQGQAMRLYFPYQCGRCTPINLAFVWKRQHKSTESSEVLY